MSYTVTLRHGSLNQLAAAIRKAGLAVANALDLLVNSGQLLREVERLNGESDEALAVRGTSRSAEVNRIFGARYY